MHKLSFYSEYVEAVLERQYAAAVPDSGLVSVEVGDRMQNPRTMYSGEPTHGIRVLQNAINNMADSFLKTRDSLGNALPTSFDGSTDVNPFESWTASDLWYYVTGGASSNGPRRYTLHPSGGGVASYGVAVDGDIIGLWVFEDLQKALNELLLILAPASGTGSVYWDWEWQGVNENDRYASKQSYEGPATPSWSDLKSDLEAAFNAGADYGMANGHFIISDSYPDYYSILRDQQGHPTYPGREGFLSHTVQNHILTNGARSVWNVGGQAEFYVYPTTLGFTTQQVFDDFGTGWVEGEWKRYDLLTFNDQKTSPIVSNVVVFDDDPDTRPLWPATNPGFDESHERGMKADEAAVVVRHNVAGGFEYVP